MNIQQAKDFLTQAIQARNYDVDGQGYLAVPYEPDNVTFFIPRGRALKNPVGYGFQIDFSGETETNFFGVDLTYSPQKEQLELLIKSMGGGRAAYHVRFHQSVPPGIDKEPMLELKLESTFDGKMTPNQKRYVVESLTWTPQGVIFEAYGELVIVPLANVSYCRLVK